jgi:hypothetical protein
LPFLFAAIGYSEGGLLSKEMGSIAVISWALVISLPINLIASYFFYETTQNGITLDSYKHLLDQDVFHTYDNIPNFKNTARDKLEDLYEEERSKIKKVNSQMNISKFKGLSAGAYGSQLHKIDIYDKKVEAPIKYRYKAPYKLNANAPITTDMKIANTTLTQIDEAKNYFISYNSGSYSNFENYHSPTDQSILKAEAYHHNLDSIIQEITIPGDFDLESGNLIELSIQKCLLNISVFKCT